MLEGELGSLRGRVSIRMVLQNTIEYITDQDSLAITQFTMITIIVAVILFTFVNQTYRAADKKWNHDVRPIFSYFLTNKIM